MYPFSTQQCLFTVGLTFTINYKTAQVASWTWTCRPLRAPRTWPLSHSLTACRSRSAVGTECEALSRFCQRRASADSERGGQGQGEGAAGFKAVCSSHFQQDGRWDMQWLRVLTFSYGSLSYFREEKRRLRSAWTSPAFGGIKNSRTLFLQKLLYGRYCSRALHVVNGEWLKSALKSFELTALHMLCLFCKFCFNMHCL